MTKPKLVVVGGMANRNLPAWLEAAFYVEHFASDSSTGGKPSSAAKPDAIVVLSSWVSHKHFFDARDLSEKLDVPLIISPGGWSAAIQAAAEDGLDWFLKAIESSKTPGAASEPVETLIDNAWRDAYNKEWTARQALERRYTKDRDKWAQALEKLSKVARREAAADRVVAEVREAAQAQRDRQQKVEQEIQRIVSEVNVRNQKLRDHVTTARETIDYLARTQAMLESAAAAVANAKAGIVTNLDELRDVFKSDISVGLTSQRSGGSNNTTT